MEAAHLIILVYFLCIFIGCEKITWRNDEKKVFFFCFLTGLYVSLLDLYNTKWRRNTETVVLYVLSLLFAIFLFYQQNQRNYKQKEFFFSFRDQPLCLYFCFSLSFHALGEKKENPILLFEWISCLLTYLFNSTSS